MRRGPERQEALGNSGFHNATVVLVTAFTVHSGVCTRAEAGDRACYRLLSQTWELEKMRADLLFSL